MIEILKSVVAYFCLPISTIAPRKLPFVGSLARVLLFQLYACLYCCLFGRKSCLGFLLEFLIMHPDFLLRCLPSDSDTLLEAYHILSLRQLPDYPRAYRAWLLGHIHNVLHYVLREEFPLPYIADVLRNASQRLTTECTRCKHHIRRAKTREF